MQAQGTAKAPALSVTDRVEAALALHGSGRFAEALELLSIPGEYAQDACNLRGDLQLELGRVHEALGSFSTVIALDRRNMYAHQKLATCLRRLGRWETAVETLRKILAQDSYCDAARLGLGECLLQLNKPEEALASFESCWSESSVAPSLFGKAVALQLLRRFQQAERMYQSFLELNPSSEEALSNLIALSMEQSAFADAQRHATQLIGLRPQSVIALQALLVTSFERREFESAAEYYRRLMDAVPAGKSAAGKGHTGIQYRMSPEDAEQLRRYVPPSRIASRSR